MSHHGLTRNDEDALPSVTVEERKEAGARGVGPDEPAAHAFRLSMQRVQQRLLETDPLARQGNVEGVHQMRTAARRLRSELRMFRDLLDGDWVRPLAEGLQWWGRLLGAVRDLDVMRQRLREASGELGEELGPLFTALNERHTRALADLRAAFQGERYQQLHALLAEAVDHPRFRDEAWEPCRTALPPLVHATWRRLKRAGRALDLGAHVEEYHDVRKRAKRTRYCAETAAPTLDHADANAARRLAKRARAVQDILGDHQDATVACQEIRRIVADHPGDGPFNLAAGRLLERQENAAASARAGFFRAWRKLDRKLNRQWMKV
jgi:CHAD domain-containing protein